MLLIFEIALITFSGILSTVIPFIFFFILLGQYLNDYRNKLKLLAVLFLMTFSLGMLFMLAGYVLLAQGNIVLGQWFEQLHFTIAPIAGLFLFFYIAEQYYTALNKRIVKLVGILVSVPTFILMSMILQRGLAQAVRGSHYPAGSIIELQVAFVPLILLYILIVFSAGREYRKKGLGSDKYLMWAGILSLFLPLLGAINIFSGIFSLLGPAIIVIITAALFGLGLATNNHKIRKYNQRPLSLITSNLTLKTVLISTFLFLFLTLLMSSIASLVISDRLEKIERNGQLQLLSSMQELYEERTSDMRLESVILVEMVSRAGTDFDENDIIDLWAEKIHGEQNVQVNINFENHYSPPVNNDLGRDNFAYELINTDFSLDQNHYGDFVVITKSEFSSVSFGKGTITIVKKFDFDSLAGVTATDGMSGGVINNEGKVLLVFGDELDMNFNELKRDYSFSYEDGYVGQVEGASSLYMKPLKASDEFVNGYIYSYRSQESKDKMLIALQSNIIFVGLLFSAFSFCILYLLFRAIIRPIDKLRLAAEKIKQGNLSTRVTLNRDDELGKLGLSFNSMARSIKRMTSVLKEKVREQHDFMNHVAHELKTPISSIKWAIELMSAEDMEEKERKAFLKDMANINNAMKRLVTDLLHSASLDQGNLELKIKPVVVKDVLQQALNDLKILIRENKTEIKADSLNQNIEVLADKEILQHVLINIINNAIKYSPKDGSGLVEISAKAQGSRILISVKDNGIGIPEDQKDMIFKKFYRTDNAIKSGIEGTGLGLYLAREIAKLQKGDIWFESNKDGGTTVFVAMPKK